VKPVVWLGSSLDDVRSFPDEPRAEIGYQLYKVQMDLDPSDWKPMPSVGAGVREIRVRVGNAYRVIYLATFKEAIYVLHAFMKKTAKTPKSDIDLARKRLAILIRERSRL
jgi:phage-related protein